MPERNTAPPIKDAIEFNLKLKPYNKITLANGVKAYTVDAGSVDVIQLELVFYAGNSFETKNGIAAATNSLLKSGTSTKTSFQISEHFEYYGSFFKRTCRNEFAIISLHTPTKHLPHLLPVIREMITDAVFPEEELAIYKQNSKQHLSVNKKKCDFVADHLIDTYLFGKEHPYGKFSEAEDYDALQREDLKKFYTQHYINGNCILFAAGKLPADLLQQLNTYFGDLPLKSKISATKVYDIVPATEKQYRIQNDASGVQGAIRIARPFPNRHHPDFTKALILNTVLGGFFGSRLMSNIREEKGYTYGIYSHIMNYMQESAWLISTEAGKDVYEATVEEIYKEMTLLKEEIIDEDELLLVKNYMIGSILSEMDGPFQIIGRWKNLILSRLPEKHFYNSIETIKTVSAEELRLLAQKYFSANEFYELVVI